MLRNLGNGRFQDISTVLDHLTLIVWIPRIDLVDIDGDGDVDLIGRPWDDRDPNPILWVNRGGRFVLTQHDFGVDSLYYDFVDWDGDGDIDIVLTQDMVKLLRSRPPAGPCTPAA